MFLTILNYSKVFSNIFISDLEKLFTLKREDLIKLLKKFLFNGDLKIVIDEYNDEIEFLEENDSVLSNNRDITILKNTYQKMNNLQKEIIEQSN